MNTITNNGIVIGRANMFYSPLRRLMQNRERKELITSVGYSISNSLDKSQNVYLENSDTDEYYDENLEEKVNYLIYNREFELPLGVSVDSIADAIILKNDIANIIQKYEDMKESGVKDPDKYDSLAERCDNVITRLNKLLETNYEHEKVL